MCIFICVYNYVCIYIYIYTYIYSDIYSIITQELMLMILFRHGLTSWHVKILHRCITSHAIIMKPLKPHQSCALLGLFLGYDSGRSSDPKKTDIHTDMILPELTMISDPNGQNSDTLAYRRSAIHPWHDRSMLCVIYVPTACSNPAASNMLSVPRKFPLYIRYSHRTEWGNEAAGPCFPAHLHLFHNWFLQTDEEKQSSRLMTYLFFRNINSLATIEAPSFELTAKGIFVLLNLWRECDTYVP